MATVPFVSHLYHCLLPTSYLILLRRKLLWYTKNSSIIYVEVNGDIKFKVKLGKEISLKFIQQFFISVTFIWKNHKLIVPAVSLYRDIFKTTFKVF